MIKLRWSKKEKDWLFSWIDNSGKGLMGVFFDMIKISGHRMDWKKELKTMLEEHGYDYTTLKITVKKIKPNEHNPTTNNRIK